MMIVDGAAQPKEERLLLNDDDYSATKHSLPRCQYAPRPKSAGVGIPSDPPAGVTGRPTKLQPQEKTAPW